MSKETAEQIIDSDKLHERIMAEAYKCCEELLDCITCKASIIRQIASWFNGEISKEKLAENLGINFYEMDSLLTYSKANIRQQVIKEIYQKARYTRVDNGVSFYAISEFDMHKFKRGE